MTNFRIIFNVSVIIGNVLNTLLIIIDTLTVHHFNVAAVKGGADFYSFIYGWVAIYINTS